MSIRKRILYSLAIGFISLLVSLVYKTGSTLEPMPYLGNYPNAHILNGVVVCCQKPEEPAQRNSSSVLAGRGFPLQVVSIAPDGDSSSSYYRAFIIRNTALDLLLYAAISYAVLLFWNSRSKSKR